MQEGRVRNVAAEDVRCGANYREVPALLPDTTKLLRRVLHGYARRGPARVYHVKDEEVLGTLPDTTPQRTCTTVLKLCQLVMSVATQGIINPPTVTKLPPGEADGKLYCVLAGERRWFAVKFLGWTEVEVCVREGSPTDLRILRLTENLQRDDPNPFEDGEEFNSMLAADPTLTQRMLADRINKSVAFVSQRLSVFSKSVPEVRTAFENGLVNATDVRKLCMRPLAEQRREVRRLSKPAARSAAPRAARTPSAASMSTPNMDQALDVEKLACRPTHEVVEVMERLMGLYPRDLVSKAELRGMVYAVEYVLQARGELTLEGLHETA